MTRFARKRQAWIFAVAGFGSACSSDPPVMPTAAPSAVPGAASSLGRLPALDQLADYATRLREGDDGVVPLVIRIGRGAAPAIERAAAEALVQHPRLRAALSFRGPIENDRVRSFDAGLLLLAADEWHHENVLGLPSPWRMPSAEALAPPFLAAKQEVLALLDRKVRASHRLRVVDPAWAEDDPRRCLVFVNGHMVVDLWHPEPDAAVCERLQFRRGAAHATFAEDDVEVTAATMTLPHARYHELIAGVRTALAAELVPWWQGPASESASGISGSHPGFLVFGLDGAGAADSPPLLFCGEARTSAARRAARLSAAVEWGTRFVAQHATPATEIAIDAATKRRFAACFRRYQELLGGETKLVRERMVAMAGPLGDAAMLPLLVRYLEPPYPLGEAGQRRTAANAINALASITGVELRFAADGTALPVDAAADLYRQHLGR